MATTRTTSTPPGNVSTSRNLFADDFDAVKKQHNEEVPSIESSETTESMSTMSEANDQEQEEESAEERRLREEEESMELARMLMAEEAMASYQQSVQALQENRDHLSEEDFEALQAILREDRVEQEEEAAAQLEEDDDGNLSYDTMLQIGERIGDVRSERWAMVAQKHIDELPTETFTQVQPNADDSEVKCLVCQHEYACGETLRRLPCGHVFHCECVDPWLLKNDNCPYCRTCLRKEK